MDVALVILVVLLAAAAVVVLVVRLRGRRTARAGAPTAAGAGSSLARVPSGEMAALAESPVDLDTVMAEAGATLYIPVDSERTYLAVAHPDTPVEGRASDVPSQLAGAALAGQAGLEAMVKAGQLSGRLVVVDPNTAAALKAGEMVTDKAGEILALIRSSDSSRWAAVTRIKPLSGGLVRSAASGPAVLSAIAMQAQLAQVEKSIGEVRDAVNAVQGYLEAAERASVEGRRDTLATVYRTAQESGQMTQSLWDQIQDLESPLRRDVKLADRFLAEQVGKLEQGASGLVGSRLKWLEDVGGPLAEAVAGVADARRSLVQFSMLRLWWLAAVGDPTLPSRQSQLRELLAELPDHADEQARIEAVLEAAGALRVHHRVLAPLKHKHVAPEVRQAQLEMHELPWKIVDVRRAAQLES